jgi:dipeptidyl aminopeptidase
MAGHEGEAATLLPLELENKRRVSEDSVSSASTTSLTFERIGEKVADDERISRGTGHAKGRRNMVTPKFPPRGESLAYADEDHADGPLDEDDRDDYDLETGPFLQNQGKAVDKKFRRLLWVIAGVFIGAWVLAFVLFIWRQSYRHASTTPHDPAATTTRGNGKQITMDQVMGGEWRANMI